MTTCRLLCDAPRSGPWNMAVDEVLLHRAAHQGLCSLRFYLWSEPTLSLGYFQALGDRAQHPASQACPVVRRPSGGGAIVHDRELTYAIAVPDGAAWARRRDELYRRVHQALIDLLARWGIRASLFGISRPAPDDAPGAVPRESLGHGLHGKASPLASDRMPFLCFQRRAPGDVVVGDAKVAGSAQRRLRGAVLQHGSVILGRSPAAPELPALEEWANRPIDAHRLAQAWLPLLGQTLECEFFESPLSGGEEDQARQLAQEKYSSAGWTARR